MKGIISKKNCKLFENCFFLNKKFVFYIVKMTLFVCQTKKINLYNTLEIIPFIKFVGLRKGLTLI